MAESICAIWLRIATAHGLLVAPPDNKKPPGKSAEVLTTLRVWKTFRVIVPLLSDRAEGKSIRQMAESIYAIWLISRSTSKNVTIEP